MIIICEVHPRFDPVPSIKTFIGALSNFLNVTNTTTAITTNTTNNKRPKTPTPSSALLPISEVIQCHHAANIFSSPELRGGLFGKELDQSRWKIEGEGIVEVYFQLQLVGLLSQFQISKPLCSLQKHILYR